MDEVTTIPKIRRVFKATYANLPTTGISAEDLGYATDQTILYRWSGAAWEAITALAATPTYSHHFFPSSAYFAINQGTWVKVNPSAGAALYNAFGRLLYNSTVANGDSVSYKVWLKAGTYQLDFLYNKHVNCGNLDVFFNANKIISALDMYGASGTYEWSSTNNLVIATDAEYELRFTLNGKNVSSSMYKLNFGEINISRYA